jgi:hypothetical protein
LTGALDSDVEREKRISKYPMPVIREATGIFHSLVPTGGSICIQRRLKFGRGHAQHESGIARRKDNSMLQMHITDLLADEELVVGAGDRMLLAVTAFRGYFQSKSWLTGCFLYIYVDCSENDPRYVAEPGLVSPSTDVEDQNKYCNGSGIYFWGV